MTKRESVFIHKDFSEPYYYKYKDTELDWETKITAQKIFNCIPEELFKHIKYFPKVGFWFYWDEYSQAPGLFVDSETQYEMSLYLEPIIIHLERLSFYFTKLPNILSSVTELIKVACSQESFCQ
jgi:hypothetical protein